MDIVSISSLPSAPAFGERKAKLQKVACDMEAIWVAQILKETRPKGGMMDTSFAAQTFQDMLGQQLAQDMAKKGVLGLADTLVRQLSQDIAKPASAVEAAPNATIEGASR